jgi:hypothetical protein
MYINNTKTRLTAIVAMIIISTFSKPTFEMSPRACQDLIAKIGIVSKYPQHAVSMAIIEARSSVVG